MNEPQRRDGSKPIDISPAREHGELVHLTPAGDPPLESLAWSVAKMDEILRGFTSEDFILPCGHPLLIAAAGALAADATGGLIRMLVWRGSLGRYMTAEVRLPWEIPA